MMDRREILAGSALMCTGMVCRPGVVLSQTMPPYEVLVPTNTINRQFATCNDLQAIVAKLRDERTALRRDWQQDAERMREQVTSMRARWKSELDSASTAQSNAEKERFVSRTAFAAGLILTAIGAVVTSPLAVGAVVGASVLAGPLLLVLQAYVKPRTTDVSIIVGYSTARFFTLGEIVGEQSRGTAGRIVGRACSVVSLSLSAYSLYSAETDHSAAVARATEARTQIARLEDALSSFGTNRSAWANLKEKALTGAIDGMEKFITDTRANNCIVIGTAQGPTIGPLR